MGNKMTSTDEEREENKESLVAQDYSLFLSQVSSIQDYLVLLTKEKKSKKLKKQIQ